MIGFIFGPFVWLKNYLSHVRETSWHYKLVYSIYGRNTQGKACTYYWLKFPSAILVLGLLGFLVVIFGGVVIVSSWFIGYTPTMFKTEDPFLKDWLAKNTTYWGREPSYYPYGYTSRGKKRHIFPWQVSLVVVIIGLVYYLSFANPSAGTSVGIIVASIAGAVILIGILSFVIAKGWRTSAFQSAGSAIGTVWDKACPPLVVVSKTETGQNQNS